LDNNLKKGIIFAVFGNIFVGFQPIVAISKPDSIDNLLFAMMTVFVEAIIFLPIMLLEIKRLKKKQAHEVGSVAQKYSFFKNFRKNLWFFLIIGLIFGINQVLFFYSYQMAGAVNGSLTQKTTVFFGLLFGYLILKERVNIVQILFSIILFFGLMISITQGFTLVGEFDTIALIGILIMLGISCLWMFGHSITRPLFIREEATPIQMVFIRNFLSGIIIFLFYIIFFPIGNFSQLLIPINLWFSFLMGLVYGAGLFCWYKTLSYLDVSKATILLSPTPIVTAVFAVFILGDVFTLYNLLGTIIVIVSIAFIMKYKKD